MGWFNHQLFIWVETTNQCWSFLLPFCWEVKGPRINLTWRWIVAWLDWFTGFTSVGWSGLGMKLCQVWISFCWNLMMFNQKIMVYLTFMLYIWLTTETNYDFKQPCFFFCDAFHRSLLLGGCGWELFGGFKWMCISVDESYLARQLLFLQPSWKSKSGSWRDECPSKFFGAMKISTLLSWCWVNYSDLSRRGNSPRGNSPKWWWKLREFFQNDLNSGLGICQ